MYIEKVTDCLDDLSTTSTFGATEVRDLAHEILSDILAIDMDKKYVLHIARFVIAAMLSMHT